MSQENDLAQNRTEWAEDRTILANERTFAGWMRTGMAAVALAIGLRAVFGAFEPTWLAKLVASIFIVLAVFIFWAAQSSARQTLSRLNDNQAHAQPVRRMQTIAILLALGAVATGGILWAL
jgi:putative membrane protein